MPIDMSDSPLIIDNTKKHECTAIDCLWRVIKRFTGVSNTSAIAWTIALYMVVYGRNRYTDCKKRGNFQETHVFWGLVPRLTQDFEALNGQAGIESSTKCNFLSIVA